MMSWKKGLSHLYLLGGQKKLGWIFRSANLMGNYRSSKIQTITPEKIKEHKWLTIQKYYISPIEPENCIMETKSLLPTSKQIISPNPLLLTTRPKLWIQTPSMMKQKVYIWDYELLTLNYLSKRTSGMFAKTGDLKTLFGDQYLFFILYQMYWSALNSESKWSFHKIL